MVVTQILRAVVGREDERAAPPGAAVEPGIQWDREGTNLAARTFTHLQSTPYSDIASPV